MKIRKIKNNFLALLLVISSGLSFAQMKDIGKFTAGGLVDAQKLMTAYLTPWANALGTSLSGGWYNTAKVHKLGGFDLTFTLNMGLVPPSDKKFNLDDLALEADYTENIAPTAAGKNQTRPELNYAGGLLHYNTPKGTGLGFIPSPMIQAGIGFIKGIEIDGRYMPNVELGKYGSFGLWGIGLKHDILQWLPVAEKLPVLSLAIQGGYTKLNYRKSMSILPGDIGATSGNDQTTDPAVFDDQRLDLTVQSFTANLLIGANFPVICFYGGLGIANTKTEVGFQGNLPLPVEGSATITDASVLETSNLGFKIKNNEGSPTKPRLNIGFRLKLGVITIHADYTKANYSNVTAGLGISFR